MRNVDTLIEARWIVPVEPAATVLIDHALVIDAGRVRDLLPAAAARQRYAPGQTVRRPDHVLIPGLVNAHTHAAMSLMRGFADDLPLAEWLEQAIWPAERRWVGERFVRDGTELAVAEMLLSGTTCFNDMYPFPDIVARVAAQHGMRACVGMVVVDLPTAWAADAEEYLAKGLALHDEYRGHPLITTAFAPHSAYAVSEPILARVRRLADQLDLAVHTHVHETAEEVRRSQAEFGLRPLERLQRLGLVSPALQAVHMTQLDDAEIGLCAREGVNVIHCPESNLKLASGFCPVAKLLDAGVNVALGTDGAASNNDLDMLGETRSAALLAKGVAGDPTAVDAHTALRMATLNGARALGLDAATGSLVSGKWADIACIGLDRVNTTPAHDPVSQLVYAAGREQVTDVWIAGRRVVHHGSLASLDLAGLKDRAEAWIRRLNGKSSDG